MKLDIKLNKPIRDIYPVSWQSKLNMIDLDVAEFRNLQHFKNYVSNITQIQDNTCGVTYAKALDDLLKEKSPLNVTEYESIRNLVRSNLLKRGLITEEIYERFMYTIDGVPYG